MTFAPISFVEKNILEKPRPEYKITWEDHAKKHKKRPINTHILRMQVK